MHRVHVLLMPPHLHLMFFKVQEDSPFILGIQIQWQLHMMTKFGHNNALSVSVTFGTSQTWVSHSFLSLNVLHVLHLNNHKRFRGGFYLFHVVAHTSCFCAKVCVTTWNKWKLPLNRISNLNTTCKRSPLNSSRT